MNRRQMLKGLVPIAAAATIPAISMGERSIPLRIDLSKSREVQRLMESQSQELERVRMQLAACGVLANSNTPETLAANRVIHPDYDCDSVQMVVRMVEREIAQREEMERLQGCNDGLHDEIGARGDTLGKTNRKWDDRLESLRELTAVSTSKGNADHDDYMHGMANGMILAVAVMEDSEPAFLSSGDFRCEPPDSAKATPDGVNLFMHP